MDMIWTITAFSLTLLVILTYLLFGDNPIFRIVTYIFIGVAAGYVVILTLHQVILPRMIRPLLTGGLTERLLALVPLVLGILLLTKLFPRASGLGNVSMGYLVGAGAAVLIGGAVLGTLFGQTRAAIQPFSLNAGLVQNLEGIVLLFGTVTTLTFFHFGARSKLNQAPRRSPLIELSARFGQVFIAITLGALFAGVFSASIVALIERLDFLINTILRFL
jgi:hypothetical protein